MKTFPLLAARLLGCAALLIGLTALTAPLAARAQTPGTFVPMSATATGQGSMTLLGGNMVSVTMSGVTPGASFNVFGCVTAASVPTPGICVIGGQQLTASTSGQLTGTVAMPRTNLALAEVLVQNLTRPSEMYMTTLVATAGAGGGYVAPTSSGGAAPANSGGAMPASGAPSGGGGRPGY